MKSTKIRYCLFFLFAIGLTKPALSQSVKEINDGTSVQAIRTFNNDTVLIHLDTAVILNKATFNIYQKAYDKAKNVNSSIKELVGSYESLIQLQANMLDTKENYYQQLKSKFDSLATVSTFFVEKTSTGITQVSSSLSKAADNLIDTQKLLQESQKLLQEERKQSWKKQLKIGLCGFGIGVGITAVVFLVAR